MKTNVIFGGWYQRTTIHLSEVYDLFALGRSRLPLSPEKLIEFQEALDLVSITRKQGYLEYIEATTKSGISIRYYEDGLYTLSIESENIKDAQLALSEYYQDKYHPAVSFIFSLGAPTPKMLANIKTVHPTVVAKQTRNLNNFLVDERVYGEVYSKVISGDFAVYKTPNYIFVLSNKNDPLDLINLVDMQIFFREFKDQLEKYLDIHRILWEEISELKEKKIIKGDEIPKMRSKLDQYQKTINLINNRINQMGTYVSTRKSVSKELKIEEKLLKLYQYKFDTLSDTLSYIKEIWKMTSDYLSSAIQVLGEVENSSLNNSVKSLQIITSIGVVAGLLGYMTRDTFPKFTTFGFEFFVILVITTLIINYFISVIYGKLRYRMKFTETKNNI